MAHNSVRAYNTGLNTFNKFRQQYQLSESWPPPLDHIIQFLAYMSLRGLSSKTARLYLSAISFRCKIANSQDTTKHFLVAKITEGFKRTSTLRRARYPITYDILQGILTKTSVVCRDSFEAQLFSTAFSLAFLGVFRVALTMFQFCSVLNKTLKAFNSNLSGYKSHSFRLGAATRAAQQGWSAERIKEAGRWASDAYKGYILLEGHTSNCS